MDVVRGFDQRELDKTSGSILDQLPHPVFQKDVKGVFTFVNSSFVEFVGVSREEIIGRKDEHVFDSKELVEQYKLHDEELMRAYLDKGSLVPKVRLLEELEGRDGRRFKILTSKSVLLDKDGELIGVHGSFIDYSIDEENALLRETIVNGVEDVIYIHDLEGELLWMNEAGYRLVGLSVGVERVVDRLGISIFEVVSTEDHAQLNKLLRLAKLSEAGRVRKAELKVESESRVRLFEVSTKKLQFRHLWEEEVVLGVARDITESARQLRLLSSTLGKLSDAEREKTLSKVAAFMTHSFKSPINTARFRVQQEREELLGYASLKKVCDRLSVLADDLRENESLVNKFIDKFSRNLRSPEPVDVNLVISLAVKCFPRKDSLGLKDLNPSTALPPVVLDEFFAADAIYNVMHNAKRHRSTEFSVNRAIEINEGSMSVVVSINDDGDGFEEEHQGLCDRPAVLAEDGFFIRSPKETGVGLKGSYRAVQEDGGEMRIWRNGGPLGGALVEFAFPTAGTSYPLALSKVVKEGVRDALGCVRNSPEGWKQFGSLTTGEILTNNEVEAEIDAIWGRYLTCSLLERLDWSAALPSVAFAGRVVQIRGVRREPEAVQYSIPDVNDVLARKAADGLRIRLAEVEGGFDLEVYA